MSCRKGPEDPLISLTTRKTRISKDWKAYNYLLNGQEQLYKNTTTTNAVGECGTQTIVRIDSMNVRMSFSKDGSHSSSNFSLFSENSTVTNPGSTICNALVYSIGDSETIAQTGYWNFTGGIGNTSAREQVFIYAQETQMGLIWDIVRLANDELKLKRRYIKPGESVFTTEEIWFKPL